MDIFLYTPLTPPPLPNNLLNHESSWMTVHEQENVSYIQNIKLPVNKILHS